MPRLELRWLTRSSLRSSKGECQRPFSSRTTLMPASASTQAVVPPPAPEPTTTALTRGRAMALPLPRGKRGRAHPRREGGRRRRLVQPAAHRRVRHPEHAPGHAVLVAAVTGVAVEAHHRVPAELVEELAGVDLPPVAHVDRALLDGAQHLDLPLGRELGEAATVPA